MLFYAILILNHVHVLPIQARNAYISGNAHREVSYQPRPLRHTHTTQPSTQSQDKVLVAHVLQKVLMPGCLAGSVSEHVTLDLKVVQSSPTLGVKSHLT